MQTDSDHPFDGVSTSSVPQWQRYLIPRSQIRRFVIQFTLMTILGWIVGEIASVTLEKTLLYVMPPVVGQQLTWYSRKKYLSDIVFAGIFGADQAFVINKYLSGWLWMLATSMGWLIANSISTVWNNDTSSIALFSNKTLSPLDILVLGILSIGLQMFAGIWFGLCQWWVLRRFTTGVWWWIFLPSISFLLISISVGLLTVVATLFPETIRSFILNFCEQGLTAVILGIVPALGLCLLKKNFK